MSRRRRSKSEVITHALDVFAPPRTLAPLIKPYSEAADYRLIEDRRTHHPLDFFRPPLATDGGHIAPVRVTKKPFKTQLPFGLQFAAPEKTLVCVRRNQRKEVLHALRKTGRGRSRKSPRRNYLSGVRC